MEMPIEMVLKIEEITNFDLSFVHRNSCVFDGYTTSFRVSYSDEFSVFSHNKHYYSFVTMKEFENYFHEHFYRYYDLGERDFEIDLENQ